MVVKHDLPEFQRWTKNNIKGSIEAEFLWTLGNRKMAQSYKGVRDGSSR